MKNFKAIVTQDILYRSGTYFDHKGVQRFVLSVLFRRGESVIVARRVGSKSFVRVTGGKQTAVSNDHLDR